jgi:hypothetical protein
MPGWLDVRAEPWVLIIPRMEETRLYTSERVARDTRSGCGLRPSRSVRRGDEVLAGVVY